ncbi:hypothetical protein V6Z11_A10G224100 [Gossypium hirsutum]|uniref:Retrovirus-related Pol polyprotein from transposon TNT 1-94-like beta-barrel domain-containing protein n=1 Tax=Gossypium hirsutum TaxID=3635 RepID=A0ABM2YVK7_GOSHI|nr:uncharacterized protein LOC121208088 [Gossypium hirsutum]
MLMEDFLRSKEYWSVFEDRIQELEPRTSLTDAQKMEIDVQKLKDCKAKNHFFQAIDRPILQTLRGEFENLYIKPGETISDYFSKTMTIVNRMRTHGEQLGDVAIIEKSLRSLLPKYNFIVCSIEESKDLDVFSIDELENSLMILESKFILQENEEQALQALSTQKDSGHGNNKWKGRSTDERRNVWDHRIPDRKPKAIDKSQIKCFRCHKYGHYHSEYYPNLNGNSDEGRGQGHLRGNGRDRGREKVNFTAATDKEEEKEVTLLIMCDLNEETRKNLWYLGTSCSNHMCGDRSAFSELYKTFRTKFGDNSLVSIQGRGKVKIQTKFSSVQSISNVFYIPDLKTNLLSVGQLKKSAMR